MRQRKRATTTSYTGPTRVFFWIQRTLACGGALVALGGLGCTPAKGIPDDTAPPAWQEPDQRGPYEAGFVTLSYPDPRGKTLTIEVWYPALPDGGDEPDSYWPELNFAFGAYRDAPPDLRGAPYPLAAFSHGYGGIRYQSPYLTEHLARHGFVVASVDHEHNTFMDLDMEYAAQVLAERPGDVRHSVDHVLALSEDGHALLGGMVDGPDYAMLGHSFGAITTLIMAGGALDIDHAMAFCEEYDYYACAYTGTLGDESFDDAVADPRAVTSVAMSPGAWYLFGEGGTGLGQTTGTLVFAGDQDAELDYDEEIRPCYESMGNPKWMATLADAGHWGFSDLCEIVPIFEECHGEGWMDVEQVHGISLPITTAFLGTTLLDDDRYAPWLEPDHLSGVEGLTWEFVE